MADNIVKSFTEAEEKKLFAYLRKFNTLDAQRDLYWMMLARFTARRVETLHLMNIDEAYRAIDTNYLDIESEKQKGGKAGSVKGLDKSQKIYVVDNAKTALLGLLKVRKAIIAKLTKSSGDPEALIVSRTGTRMSIRAMQRQMKKWCQSAGIEQGTPHWWRHTWAVRRLENASGDNGKSLREIQAVLGHRYITTTQIYTTPNRGDLKSAMMEAGR